MKLYVFCIILTVIFLFCGFQDAEKKQQQEIISQLLLANQKNTNIDCNISSEPTFTELQQKEVFRNCISCHNSTQMDAGLDLTDFIQTKSIVVPFSPFQSLLYQKITSGTMATYSDTCLEIAIRRWIESGALE